MVWASRVVTLLLFVAPVCIVASGIYFDWATGTKAACVLVLAYATWEWSQHWRDPSELELAAEQVYFLGYLCTIVAFFALVLRLGGQRPLDRLDTVIFAGGVALSTTVAGLLGMAWLRATVRILRGAQPQAASSLIQVQLTGETDKKIRASLDHLVNVSSAAEHTAKRLAGQLDSLQGELAGFGKSISDGGDRMIDFVKAVDHTKHTVQELHQVLTDFIRLQTLSINKHVPDAAGKKPK